MLPNSITMDKQEYSFTCNRAWQVVLVLVAVPLTITALVVSLIITVGINWPDWAIITSVVLMILLSLAATLWLVKTQITVPVTVVTDENSITVKFLKQTLFFKQPEIKRNWSDVNALSTNYDNTKGRTFYIIGFVNPTDKLYLNEEESTEESSAFYETVNTRLQHLEQSGLHAPVDRRNFYEAPWARVFTNIIWVFMAIIAAVALFSPGEFPWWRMIQFTAFGGVWLSAYYFNTRKKR